MQIIVPAGLWSGDLLSVRADDGTLLLHRGDGLTRFFAAGDEGELTTLTADDPGAKRLLRLPEALPPRRSSKDDSMQFTEEQLEQLRSLGYAR